MMDEEGKKICGFPFEKSYKAVESWALQWNSPLSGSFSHGRINAAKRQNERKRMSIYESLNEKQYEAVCHTEGPLLILAGAGSGKTRVLTHRIAYLIEEKGVNPWNIMAITFTNKAAQEMRERVDKIVGFGAESIWVATFHSSCVRILRRHIDMLGYDTNFSIYDSDDQKTLMRQVLKTLDLDPKLFKEKSMLAMISSAKDEMISPEEAMTSAGGDFRMQTEAKVYAEYQKKLKENNALDFDDLLVKTVELFENNPQILDYYQERFRYIMVDEYQDTNTVQFKFVSTLAKKYKNLCVVGDDDQSIYKFRGANITNILNFESVFPGTKVIKLEQNYRSTSAILDTANAVIRHNRGRKEKSLWTDKGQGETVQFKLYDNAYEEAEGVIRGVKRAVEEDGLNYSDCAVLYRTNAQSRAFEEKCIAMNIPYRLIGGVNFYQRQEIKDILAYLKTVDNGRDDIAVRRIINVPKRGIGQTTIDRVQTYADQHGISFFNALEYAEQIPALGRAATVNKLKSFVNQIMVYRAQVEYLGISKIIENILESTGYLEELEELDDEKAIQKRENLDELISKAADYEESTEEDEPTLSGFLEEVALVADIDSMDASANRLVLMTLHGAKGLEFPRVYLCGMEEGLFPSYMSMMSGDPTDIEEERRLCYVGITRAMDHLTLTAAKMRTVHGDVQYNRPSRFIDEIPEELLDRDDTGSGMRLSVSSGQVSQNKNPQKEGLGGFGLGRSSGGFGFGAAMSRFGQGSGRTSPKSMEDVFDLPKKNTYGKGFSSPTPSMGKAFTVQKQDGLSYKEGDTVRHIKFGIGTVREIEEGKKDYEVTVDFETAGVKRMFASFARLQKVEK